MFGESYQDAPGPIGHVRLNAGWSTYAMVRRYASGLVDRDLAAAMQSYLVGEE